MRGWDLHKKLGLHRDRVALIGSEAASFFDLDCTQGISGASSECKNVEEQKETVEEKG